MPADQPLDPQRTLDSTTKSEEKAHPSEAHRSTVSLDQTTEHCEQGATTHDKGGARDSARGKPSADLPHHPDYEFTAEIARGGMGRVLAAREIALDRQVAIKTLLPGANAGRFVTESKITARLPHPGIPPVHALGTLADGSPFLAMKLVWGRTLADLLSARPSLDSDLSRFVHIFEQVAQAVGFAHAQGIIHRDLKPANIMVGAFGEVQVMDWGLARGAGESTDAGDSSVETPAASASVIHTQAGTIMGTPAFMAPEQARGECVDARADVFALGGILAQILSGHVPFQGGSALETVAKAASGNTRKIVERLHDCPADKELTELALSCLKPNAGERPANGEHVAQLVARYREGVEARLRQAEADRAAQQAKIAEQLKRRRVVRIAAGVVIGVLVLGIIGTSVGLVLADGARRREADRAEGERLAKLDAKDKEQQAVIAKEAAQNRLTQVQKGNEILGSIFRDLDIRAIEQSDEDIKVVLARRLTNAAESLKGDAIGDPLVVADLQTQLADSLVSVGYFSDASKLNEEARATREQLLGANALSTLESMHNLSVCYRSEGKYDEAVTLLEQVCDLREEALGPDARETLISKSSLVFSYRFAERIDDAVALGEETLPRLRAQLGDESRPTIMCMNALATGYMQQGNIGQAMPLLEESRRLSEVVFGAEHPETIIAMGNLSMGLRIAGQFDLALPLAQQTMELIQTKMGTDHPDSLIAMQNVANVFHAVGRADLALPIARQVLELKKSKLGETHAETLACMTELGSILDSSGEYDEAQSLLRAALDLMQEQLGPDHLSTLECMNALAICLRNTGQVDEAATLLREALALTREKLGNDHPKTFVRMNDLAVVLRFNGEIDEAAELLKQVWEATKAQRGADHPEALSSMDNLAQCYMSGAKLDLAVPLFEEAMRLREGKFGRESMATMTTVHNLAWAYYYSDKADSALPCFQEVSAFMQANFGEDHPNTLTLTRSLAICHQKLGQLNDAANLLEETLALSRARYGDEHFLTLMALGNLGDVYVEAERPDEAETLLEACFTVNMKTNPDSWQTYRTQSLLGASLAAQSKYELAEPALVDGYNGMKSRFDKIPRIQRDSLMKAIDRLISLYQATRNADALEQWQAEKEAMESKIAED